MKRLSRSQIVRWLTLIVLLIGFCPLLPLATLSKSFARTLTGECAGDCAICGCAPERSAARTCCCWQKRLHTRHAEEPPDQGGSCCQKSRPAPAPRCTPLPCGSGKLFALWGSDSAEYLPLQHHNTPIATVTGSISPSPCRSPNNRLQEPPDPPPKVSHLS